ncbi:hypothetical protein [Alteromonas sp. ASW11-130]|uniref:hypothetical protein n=1 Tax=Alteromonas sp. ASW11-130 TaxID=3015775 RepID=UPI002242795A|nr:hypothetical protein [Alteromonas sp. ASW11-130]MCW8093231.1 hypothetical protein [Alteromonas sp. ASW11-130]
MYLVFWGTPASGGGEEALSWASKSLDDELSEAVRCWIKTDRSEIENFFPSTY